MRAATTIAARFVAAFGVPCLTPFPELCWGTIAPERLARASLASVAALGLPRARAEAVLALARAVSRGALHLEPGGDRERTLAALVALPGIGEWTGEYVALRALRSPDAFPHTDLGLRRALSGLTPRRMLERAERWRPWRAYAALYLWEVL